MNLESFIENCPKILIVLDPKEIKQAVKAQDMLSLLFDFDNYLRGLVKYNEDPNLSDAADKIRGELARLMEENGISFDELYP